MADKNLAIFDKNTSAALPTFAQDHAGMGMENVGVSDMSTPQIKVLQALSPDLEQNPELKAGQLLNSVSKQAFTELFCANLHYTSSYSIFNKRARQLVDKADSLEAAQAIVNGLPGSPADYELQETKTHYCVAFDINDKGVIRVAFPFVMYLKKTQITMSNQWNTMINNQYGDSAARFAGIWKLSTTKRSNDQGTWYVPTVEFAGYVPDANLYNELKTTYEAITGKTA